MWSSRSCHVASCRTPMPTNAAAQNHGAGRIAGGGARPRAIGRGRRTPAGRRCVDEEHEERRTARSAGAGPCAERRRSAVASTSSARRRRRATRRWSSSRRPSRGRCAAPRRARCCRSASSAAPIGQLGRGRVGGPPRGVARRRAGRRCVRPTGRRLVDVDDHDRGDVVLVGREHAEARALPRTTGRARRGCARRSARREQQVRSASARRGRVRRGPEPPTRRPSHG